MTLRPTLDEIEADINSQFLFACVINLYSETMRRRCERIMYSPKDVRALIEITRIILDVNNEKDFWPKARDHQATEEEVEAIATVEELPRRRV